MLHSNHPLIVSTENDAIYQSHNIKYGYFNDCENEYYAIIGGEHVYLIKNAKNEYC